MVCYLHFWFITSLIRCMFSLGYLSLISLTISSICKSKIESTVLYATVSYIPSPLAKLFFFCPDADIKARWFAISSFEKIAVIRLLAKCLASLTVHSIALDPFTIWWAGVSWCCGCCLVSMICLVSTQYCYHVEAMYAGTKHLSL